MQPNEIILSVDKANDGNLVTETLVRTDDTSTRSQYEGPTHALHARDTVHLYRTQPKQAGNSLGVAKSAIKQTVDITVAGVNGDPVKATIIVDRSYSIPVGADPLIVRAIRQRGIALEDDDTIMDGLNQKLWI